MYPKSLTQCILYALVALLIQCSAAFATTAFTSRAKPQANRQGARRTPQQARRPAPNTGAIQSLAFHKALFTGQEGK
jgi:hypothetical protein